MGYSCSYQGKKNESQSCSYLKRNQNIYIVKKGRKKKQYET